jgi:hypothetical protein
MFLRVGLILVAIFIALFGYHMYPLEISKIMNNRLSLLILFGVSLYIYTIDPIAGLVVIASLLYLLLVDMNVIKDVLKTKVKNLLDLTKDKVENFSYVKDGKYMYEYDENMKPLKMDDRNMSNIDYE